MVETSRFSRLTNLQLFFVLLLLAGITFVLIPVQTKKVIKYSDGCVETFVNNVIVGEWCNASRNKIEASKTIKPKTIKQYLAEETNKSLSMILNLTR